MDQRIELGEVTFAYADPARAEDRDAVVFVHGLGGSLNAWRGQLEACTARGFRAIAYDQRGAGRTSKPAGPYSVELWAEDLERLCDAIAVERMALVGHSVGTMVAEQAALRMGDRAWALALVGGALEWRPEAADVFSERIALARAHRTDEIAAAVAATALSERCRRERPELWGLFVEMIAANDPHGYAESAAATARGRMVDPERVRVPTLALAGEHDPVTPPAFAEAIAATLPNARSAVVEGAAHWCQIEDPAAVDRLLLEFLDEEAPGA